MTLIPRQQEKHCFISCSEAKVNAGLCDCINRMRNEALRQPPVVGRSEQLKALMHFADFAKQEYGLHIPLNLMKEYVKSL